MFKFNFGSFEETPSHPNISNFKEVDCNACQSWVEVPFEGLFDNERITFEPITLCDKVKFLKGRIDKFDIAQAIKSDAALDHDLIPGEYEGGFKLWEASIDLARFLMSSEAHAIFESNVRVIELGCGHGLPGIVALLAGATVYFQDYNEAVLKLITIPSVFANWKNNLPPSSSKLPPAKFFSGDWGFSGSFFGSSDSFDKFDIVLTSETIYSRESLSRLFGCIRKCLKKPSGVCYIAAKTFYFGVGGGTAAFLSLVQQSKDMEAYPVHVVEDTSSVRREVLILRWKPAVSDCTTSKSRHDVRVATRMLPSTVRHVGIGFMGIGKMGFNMAENLIRAGYQLVVYDKNVDAVDKLISMGARGVASPLELGTYPGLEMVLSMLPGPKQVEEAYLGTDGLLTGETGTLHPAYIIDSSTCDPGTSRKLALAANDVHLHPDAASGSLRTTPAVIDAPVSGGVPGAQNATLTFMCGGNAADVSAVSPLLLKMGKRVIHCGGHGSGHAAKLANNIVLAISMAAVSEGLSFGLRNGLDSKVLTSIFNTSSAHCWSSEKYNPVPGVMDGVPSSRDYKGGFSTSLMLKDLKLALSAGESCRAHMPLTEVCGEMYQGVADLGNSSLDFSAVYRYIYERKDLTE